MTLETGFESPPDSARPRVFWTWMNGNVSEQGLTRDLEWLHDVGIRGVQLAEVNFGRPLDGRSEAPFGSPGWRTALRHAATVADRLGMEMAVSSSPGWSESGGPWVTPAQGMKKYVWSETIVEGGRPFGGRLTPPPSVTGSFQDTPYARDPAVAETGRPTPQFYADSAVVAFRVDQMPDEAVPQLSAGGQPIDAALLSDGRMATTIALPAATPDKPSTLVATYAAPQTISSATLALAVTIGLLNADVPPATLEASDDGIAWRKVVDFPVGSVVHHTITFAPVTARQFRVRFTPYVQASSLPPLKGAPGAAPIDFFKPPQHATIQVAEFALYRVPRVNRFEQKAAFGLAPDYYGLDTPTTESVAAIAPSEVIDLTTRMSPSGRLDWTPPPGKWIVLRIGYSLLGTENHPAPASGTGLEVDKLDAGAVDSYLAGYLDRITQAVQPTLIGGHGINAFLADSVEAGNMNWTPRILADFRRLRGYDPTPWLPVLTGRIVGSAERSDAFLYDFRRTLGDLFAANHYDRLAAFAKAHGLRFYNQALENSRVSIGDDMSLRRSADVPMGAMWTYRPDAGPQPAFVADVQGAASIAHVYGRRFVSAESFTAPLALWDYTPATLKPIVDLEFALGVNLPTIHESTSQPDERTPGLTRFLFGTTFNRHESWAGYAKPWIDYISRSSFMLQQGMPVADVAYFYGEEAPLVGLFGDRPVADAPHGHAFDFVNADMVLKDVSVVDGRFRTTGGMSYRVIYLGGQSQRMTVPVLRRLSALVDAGGTIVGDPPMATPSLADDPHEFARFVDHLWGHESGQVGRGRVFRGHDIDGVLQRLDIPKDFEASTSDGSGTTMFVHRRAGDADIYFVSNREAVARAVKMTFAVTGKAPEIWRASSGQHQPISYRDDGRLTTVPIVMNANDAFFVVFRPARMRSAQIAAPRIVSAKTIDGPWRVDFQPGRGAPPQTTLTRLVSLTETAAAGTRYFSGGATYSKSIDLGAMTGHACLDLGTVGDLADVTVNGIHLGTLWSAPYQIDIASALKPGANRLEIRVVDKWVNRLIGDAQPGATKIAFTTVPTYAPDAPLRPAGLIGPVRLLQVSGAGCATP